MTRKAILSTLKCPQYCSFGEWEIVDGHSQRTCSVCGYTHVYRPAKKRQATPDPDVTLEFRLVDAGGRQWPHNSSVLDSMLEDKQYMEEKHPGKGWKIQARVVEDWQDWEE